MKLSVIQIRIFREWSYFFTLCAMNGRISLMEMTKDIVNSRINEFVLSVQYLLELSDQDVCHQMGITQNQLRLLKSNQYCISLSKLMEFCERFHISFESILSRSVNYNCLINHFNKNLNYIPDYYLKNAKSRVRTITPIFGYVDEVHGKDLSNSILRQFQIHNQALKDPSKLINANLLKDILTYMSHLGFDEKDLYEIGQYSYQENKSGLVKTLAGEFKTEAEFLEFIAVEFQEVFDEYYNYKIHSLNKEECVMEIEHRSEICDLLETKYLGSLQVDQFKSGVISSLSSYTGFDMANVEMLSNVHEGDSSTRIKIQFSNQQMVN